MKWQILGLIRKIKYMPKVFTIIVCDFEDFSLSKTPNKFPRTNDVNVLYYEIKIFSIYL